MWVKIIKNKQQWIMNDLTHFGFREQFIVQSA